MNPATVDEAAGAAAGRDREAGTADGKDGTPNAQMAGTPFLDHGARGRPLLERRERHRRSRRAELDRPVRRHARRDDARERAARVSRHGSTRAASQTITAHDADNSSIADNTSGGRQRRRRHVPARAGPGARRVPGARHRDRPDR